MARRRCQYCTQPLGRLASLLMLYRSCSNCVYRMSIGHTPARPPTEPALPLPADGTTSTPTS